jgi:phage regulator Rha-like protein
MRSQFATACGRAVELFANCERIILGDTSPVVIVSGGMPSISRRVTADQLGRLICEVRGQRVMLDSDLADIYGVETKALNRAVKRNRHRFPKDFVFQLSPHEWKDLRYQIGTSSIGRESDVLRYQIGTLKTRRGQHRKYLPYVFTEHGAIMAANVLNSRRAVQMSVFVVRAFLKMRALLGDKRDLAQKLASLEKELKKRLDVHEAVIVTILQRVMDIIDPPMIQEPPKPRIGFKP